MNAVPPVAAKELRRALNQLADESAEHITIVKRDGLALVERLHFLEAMLRDQEIAASRFVIRDESGAILDLSREFMRVAANTPLAPELGLGPALNHAKRWLRAIKRRSPAACPASVFQTPEGRPNQGESEDQKGAVGSAPRTYNGLRSKLRRSRAVPKSPRLCGH